MTFGARPVEAGGLLDHARRRREEGRIGLDREPAGAPARGLEGGHEERRGANAHLLDDRPRQLALATSAGCSSASSRTRVAQ